jgi:hypothetical protein
MKKGHPVAEEFPSQDINEEKEWKPLTLYDAASPLSHPDLQA